ncbi:MAG: hypothetical protein DYG89_45680 [Caldilinea sp. CFX5]|nr:hypothetical protein [Caldilinea sp. CFX5]
MQQQRRRRRRHNRRPWVAPIIIGVILLVALAGVLVDRWLTVQPRRPIAATTGNATATSTAAAPAPAPPTAAATSTSAPAVLESASTVVEPTATPAAAEATGKILVPTPQPPTALPMAAVVTPTPAPEAEMTGTDSRSAATATPVGEEESSRVSQPVAAAPLNFAAAKGDTTLLPAPVVFVARQIPEKGTVYWDKPKGMPGVGPYSRFAMAAPGYLLILQPDGTVRTLIDGSNPTAASYHLIDVNAPDVSYDGTQILFAGLPAGEHPHGAMRNPGAWRLFVINVDGSGLRQLTFTDQTEKDFSQFGALAKLFADYDDTDPAWLPDGRIVFASTRYPSFGQYGGARTTNLFVINPDGSDLHRITAERNSADRPLVDPISGRVVYSRWWRNARVPLNNMETINASSQAGYRQHLGLLAETDATNEDPIPGGTANVNRNSWLLGVINPDGTGLQLFAGGSGVFLAGEDANHAYGGAFTPDGILYANYFPMRNMTEAGGFGGIRRYERGANGYTPVIGVTADGQYPAINPDPPSFGVTQSDYAAEPEVLPDGRLLISWAPDINQDYGLYVINADGSGRTLLFDQPNLTELRTRLVMARPLPPIIPDTVTTTASALPPTAAGPIDLDGTFTFNALNVYFNGPVDSEVINGIPVGQAATIRFYTDYQREQPGSLDWVDWPILLQELPIRPDGSVVAQLPANVPLFEQIRSAPPAYQVPLTGRASENTPGVAHVLGMNFGRPGEMGNCVGCHAGHSALAVPENPADAAWTNLAPGATLSASSVHPTMGDYLEGLIDRKVQKGRITAYWRSDPAQNPSGQWVQLVFPVPVTVRTVRLYNPRADEMGTIQVKGATVRLYSDAQANQEIVTADVGALTDTGADVLFPDITSRAVRVQITAVSGAFNGETVASLAEVEVIARAEAP